MSVAEQDFCRLQGLALKAIAGFKGCAALEDILAKNRNVAALADRKAQWEGEAKEVVGENARSMKVKEAGFQKKQQSYEKGKRMQALRFPKSTPITIPMDTMAPVQIKEIYSTFHNRKGVLQSCPAQNGWEDNRAFITKLSPNGRMTTLFQSLRDLDNYLGYGILFVNMASWLSTVRKAPWDQVK